MTDLEVRIEALRLRAVIGCNAWERDTLQDLVIDIRFRYNASVAVAEDQLTAAMNYKAITKSVIDFVEKSSFELLETLAARVYELVLREEMTLLEVVVAKPHALRFSDSVSVRVGGDVE